MNKYNLLKAIQNANDPEALGKDMAKYEEERQKYLEEYKEGYKAYVDNHQENYYIRIKNPYQDEDYKHPDKEEKARWWDQGYEARRSQVYLTSHPNLKH